MADRLSSETNNSAYLVSRLNRAQAENDALLAEPAKLPTSDGRGRVLLFVVGVPIAIAAFFGLLIWGGHAGAVWAGDLLSRLFS